MTFWEHLDELRGVIMKILTAVMVLTIISFLFKEEVFGIVLAPKSSDFVLYDIIQWCLSSIGISTLNITDFNIELISTQLASQFIVHMKMSFCCALLLSSPYILYQLVRFVTPALYENERRYAVHVVTWGYILYIVGALLNYFIIFPLIIRFLGTYQVNAAIPNLITLDSYISTFVTTTLLMGLMFELPIVCWLFAKLGFISARFLRHYRRHAFVIILIVGTVITPTSDVFTLLLVSIPIYILYEISIGVVALGTRNQNTK